MVTIGGRGENVHFPRLTWFMDDPLGEKNQAMFLKFPRKISFIRFYPLQIP